MYYVQGYCDGYVSHSGQEDFSVLQNIVKKSIIEYEDRLANIRVTARESLKSHNEDLPLHNSCFPSTPRAKSGDSLGFIPGSSGYLSQPFATITN
jgi:hypothetical protein